MSEEFGPDFITVTDEDGNDIDLDDEEYGLIIMKVVEEDGEELLSTLDSDEELDLIYNQFMERLFADEEMED